MSQGSKNISLEPTISEDVLVCENLGVLILRQLLQVGVGLAEQEVDEEAEKFLKQKKEII